MNILVFIAACCIPVGVAIFLLIYLLKVILGFISRLILGIFGKICEGIQFLWCTAARRAGNNITI